MIMKHTHMELMKKTSPFRKINGTFSYFFATYLLILLVPLLSLFFIYHIFVAEIEERLNNHNTAMLEAGVKNIDLLLDEIQKTIGSLQRRENVINFTNMERFEGPNTYTLELLHLMEELEDVKNLNGNIQDIFLYSAKSDAVITSTNLYMDSMSFYKNHPLQIPQEFTEVPFLQVPSYQLIPYQNDALGSNTFDGYLFAGTIPAYAKSNRVGTILILLNKTIFSNTLEEMQVGTDGLICVTDKNGKTFYQNRAENSFPFLYSADNLENSDTFVHEKNRYQVIWKRSNSSGLIYSAYLSEAFVTEHMSFIKGLVLTVLVCSLLLTILLSLFLSKNSSTPIQKLLTMFTPFPEISYKGLLSHLENNVKHVLDSYSESEARLQKQIPLIQSATLYNLLSGSYCNDTELHESLALSSIDLQADWHCVIILKLITPSKNSPEGYIYHKKISILVSDLVLELSAPYFISAYSYDIDQLKIAFLLSFNLQELRSENGQYTKNSSLLQQYMENFAKLSHDYLLEKKEIHTICAIGEVFPDINNISTSYEQAKQTVHLLPGLSQKSFYHFNDITRIDYNFYYPFEMEQRISVFMKEGDVGRVKQILKTIYVENFIKKELNHTLKRHLLLALYTTLIRSTGEVDYSVDIRPFLIQPNQATANFDEIFDSVISEFVMVSQLYLDKKETEIDSLKEQISVFIEKNYHDPDLTLSAVAQHFQISERTFYSYFKDTFQNTFTVYLENLRISKAKEFLKNDTVSVEKISEMTGYTNVRTFQRAFKRVIGHSPNEFRHNS